MSGCEYIREGIDWGRGGRTRIFCDLTDELDPDCDNCDRWVQYTKPKKRKTMRKLTKKSITNKRK